MNLIFAQYEHKAYMKHLYKRMFPIEERIPFWLLWDSHKKGRSKLYIIKKAGVLAGFVNLVSFEDAWMCMYLAIDPACQGAGLGSQLIQLLLRKLGNTCFFLSIERIERKAENYEQRIKRKAFYLRNGMKETGCFYIEAMQEYELLSNGKAADAMLARTALANIYGHGQLGAIAAQWMVSGLRKGGD